MSSGPSVPAPSTQPAPQAPAAFKPNYDILASMNSSRPTSQSPTPAARASPQAQSTSTPPPAADPFASLVSASPRATASPFQPPAPQGQSTLASTALLDLAGGTSPAPTPAGQATAAEDDEWNFASSLPPSNALPTTNKIQVLNSQLRVDFVARRVPGQPRQIHIAGVFSNVSNQPIGELHFQVAVEKVSLSAVSISYLVQSKTNSEAVLHTAASTAIGPRYCSSAAERRAAGDAPGRHRHG